MLAASHDDVNPDDPRHLFYMVACRRLLAASHDDVNPDVPHDDTTTANGLSQVKSAMKSSYFPLMSAPVPGSDLVSAESDLVAPNTPSEEELLAELADAASKSQAKSYGYLAATKLATISDPEILALGSDSPAHTASGSYGYRSRTLEMPAPETEKVDRDLYWQAYSYSYSYTYNQGTRTNVTVIHTAPSAGITSFLFIDTQAYGYSYQQAYNFGYSYTYTQEYAQTYNYPYSQA